MGTPVDVPVPRKVNVRELGMGILGSEPRACVKSLTKLPSEFRDYCSEELSLSQ